MRIVVVMATVTLRKLLLLLLLLLPLVVLLQEAERRFFCALGVLLQQVLMLQVEPAFSHRQSFGGGRARTLLLSQNLLVLQLATPELLQKWEVRLDPLVRQGIRSL
jgi:hypothetical protein